IVRQNPAPGAISTVRCDSGRLGEERWSLHPSPVESCSCIQTKLPPDGHFVIPSEEIDALTCGVGRLACSPKESSRDGRHHNSCVVNNVDDRAGFTANCEINWAATDRAVLNQRLFGLGGVDLQRKYFAAM